MRKTCPTCHKIFEAINDKKIYCTPLCYPELKRPRPSVKRICKICGKEFEGTQSSLICSTVCWLKNEAIKKALKPKIKKPLVKYSCLYCHVEFEAMSGGGNYLYCSLEHGAEYRKLRNKISDSIDFSKPNCKELLEKELERLGKEGKNYV